MKINIWYEERHHALAYPREDRSIYLGINTNINCIEDWCPNGRSWIDPHKIGLYLGKIIFENNKKGIAIPQYIPSDIDNGKLESEIEKIYPLWLDAINKDYEPFKFPPNLSRPPYPHERFPIHNTEVKFLCKRSKENITLNKEQIISYFTELHSKNTKSIKDYMDSIHKHHGIIAYLLNNHLYESLMEQGLMDSKDNGYPRITPLTRNTIYTTWEEKLLAIEYAKKDRGFQIPITYTEERFYAFLIYTLHHFLLVHDQGEVFNENPSMLFNRGAYRGYIEKDQNKPRKQKKPQEQKKSKEQYQPYRPPSDQVFYEDYFFMFKVSDYIHSEIYEDEGWSLEKAKKDYYYQRKSHEDLHTYAKIIRPIHPSKDNPPKGWTKEMMKKLELKFE
ncbi:hypothetical protein CQA53_11035 [Helicobacter didelphidarum]|uniref:Uncharacterized protein n=1 Tax=Helicobacter didelphidarum TaxID=2040648 RepID=A0A3D8I4X1_9HELI|nr:hypothetical protein [Helicobacter didelphidarum]RDU60200.1 hypothetical protein CQA53_11035 [Helicobacter didelphidarum]